MTYRAIDFETTGLPNGDATCGIMQAGWCDMRLDGESHVVGEPHGMFVDSGVPCTVGARAVHHIMDSDCVGCGITPDQACMRLMDGLEADDIFCAHNVDHEKHYFSGGEHKWICTYKTALRVWPDAPGHKLMELRYHLDVDNEDGFDPWFANPPHRAPADAYVSLFILRRLLKAEPIEKLIKWSTGPALLFMCWLKKHKGKPWHQVVQEDRPYVQWAADNVDDRDIRATAKYYLKKESVG